MISLTKGDLVEIVAPGWGGSSEDVEKAVKYVESLGLKARVPADIFGEDLVCSNTDNQRFSHLKDALYSPDSKAIWCFKGGYGTTRLLGELSKLRKPPQEKLLIGFSDITALHLFLGQNWKWQTLHAPVLWQIVNDKISGESLAELKSVIFADKPEMMFESLEQMNISSNTQGIIKSSVIGGNLALIQATIGTPWEIKAKNKIVLLEEVDERAYRVDRMLTQIRQSGIVDKAKALLLGDFIDKETQEKVDEVVRRFAEEMHIPVVSLDRVGHSHLNDPIPFGTSAELEFGEAITLRVSCY